MKVKVSRKAHFNSAHRLHNPNWSDEKNQAVFGKCNNPNYHGHNYELIVQVTGEIDPDTGYVIDVKILKDQQSPIFITTDSLGCFSHTSTDDAITFVVQSPYYKTASKRQEDLVFQNFW